MVSLKQLRAVLARSLSSFHSKNENFFVSTPVFYVNASPHIGHLYSALIADATHRFHKLLGCRQTTFSTGTDEHGTKIQEAASRAGCPILDYCDNISCQYQQLFHLFHIEYTDFVRTSQHRHITAVQHFWEKLESRGHIYKGTYSGWYCVAEESFLSGDQVKEVTHKDGTVCRVSAETGQPVHWTEETNYMFSLSAFREELLAWLRTPGCVRPAKFQRWLQDFVTNNPNSLQDLSVSRPSSRVHWGIPVPRDPEQTVYVWLDALVNYLTVCGYPHKPLTPMVHVIGKDILKFHGVFWPAFLMAAGLEPPRAILCHSHWTVNGEKMSKSLGNVVDPFSCSETFTPSGLRYFLLREGTPHSDANYSESKMARVLNSELADTLGNLLSRCCGKAVNPWQVFPWVDPDLLQQMCGPQGLELLASISALPDEVTRHYEECSFYKGVDAVMGTLRLANRMFESQRPWQLVKQQGSQDALQLRCTLHLAMETLRACGIALQPVVPELAVRLLCKLGVAENARSWNHMRCSSGQDSALGTEPAVLYQRVLNK